MKLSFCWPVMHARWRIRCYNSQCIYIDAAMQQHILFNCFRADYVDFHLHEAKVHLRLYSIYILLHIPSCVNYH